MTHTHVDFIEGVVSHYNFSDAKEQIRTEPKCLEHKTTLELTNTLFQLKKKTITQLCTSGSDLL